MSCSVTLMQTEIPVKGKVMKLTRWLALVCCCGLSSCVFMKDATEFLSPENPQRGFSDIVKGYDSTILNRSTAADAIFAIYYPDCDCEVLSQTTSVVASQGQTKRGHKVWFTMVAFDENELTAQRKYICLVDERPKVLFVEPWEALRFNTEMVIEKKVLEEPYADENTKRIAVLGQVLENLRRDIKEVGPDNKKIDILGMMINQAMETILVKLDDSPVLAMDLTDPKGLEFDHINLKKGRVYMAIERNIATVKIRLGQYVTKFGLREDIDDY